MSEKFIIEYLPIEKEFLELQEIVCKKIARVIISEENKICTF